MKLVAADATPARVIESFPSEPPVVSVRLEGVGTDSLPDGAIQIWEDGTIRFECPVYMSDLLDDPRLEPKPDVHRGALPVDRVRRLLTDVEQRGVFSKPIPHEHGGEDDRDCGWTRLELRAGAKQAQLAHWHCATATSVYNDVMHLISGAVESAPCDLRCVLFDADCSGR